jgi:hypothetical protein
MQVYAFRSFLRDIFLRNPVRRGIFLQRLAAPWMAGTATNSMEQSPSWEAYTVDPAYCDHSGTQLNC